MFEFSGGSDGKSIQRETGPTSRPLCLYEQNFNLTEEVPNTPQPLMVWDVGTATGLHLIELTTAHPEYSCLGIDRGREMLDAPLSPSQKERIRFMVADAKNLVNVPIGFQRIEEKFFHPSLVLARSSLYYVYEDARGRSGTPEDVLKSIFSGVNKWLSRGGKFLIHESDPGRFYKIYTPILESVFGYGAVTRVQSKPKAKSPHDYLRVVKAGE
jgi:hypothetical protein